MSYSRTHFSAATAAVADRFVTSTDMKRGTYGAPANSGTMPTAGARHVTITLARIDAVDSPLGTVTIAGTDINGAVISEVMTPLDNTIATSTAYFKTVTAVTGGNTWVAAGGADQIQVGCAAAAVVAVGAGTLWAVSINTAAAGTVTLADGAGTIAILASNATAGNYLYNVSWSGYLSVTAAAGTDLTIIHSASLPTSYAMA